MPFFTLILDFKRTLLSRLRNKRRHVRYRTGADFPLMAMVNLADDDGFPAKKSGPRPGSDWNGRVHDLSANGLSVRLPVAAATVRNETTIVRLTIEGHELAIPCTVAHFKVQQGHGICGLRLDFSDFALQKAWLQIVEAVSIGAAFAPVGDNRTPRVSLGLARRQWRSVKQSQLTEWRETGTDKLDRFELTVAAHRIERRVAEPGMVICPEANPGQRVPAAVEKELCQLCEWITANLPSSVPADLRKFMRSAASRQAAAPAARKPAPRPPSEWQPPKRPTRSPG